MNEYQKQISEALLKSIQEGRIQPNNIVLGDYVETKIESGGHQEIHNHYTTPPQPSTSTEPNFSPTPSPSPSEPYLAQDALFKYIHPSISTDADKSQITREIQNLVSSFPLPEICRYLIEMKKSNRIYLNVKPELAFAELHRLGMPDEQTEGFAYKTFTKYYNVN